MPVETLGRISFHYTSLSDVQVGSNQMTSLVAFANQLTHDSAVLVGQCCSLVRQRPDLLQIHRHLNLPPFSSSGDFGDGPVDALRLAVDPIKNLQSPDGV